MEDFAVYVMEHEDEFESMEELIRAFCNEKAEDLWSWQAMYEMLIEDSIDLDDWSDY